MRQAPWLGDVTAVPVSPDEDLISSERQKAEGIGPDYDPTYFDRLDAWLEECFGPLGEFIAISGDADSEVARPDVP